MRALLLVTWGLLAAQLTAILISGHYVHHDVVIVQLLILVLTCAIAVVVGLAGTVVLARRRRQQRVPRWQRLGYLLLLIVPLTFVVHGLTREWGRVRS